MEKNMAEEKFLIENYGKKSTFASFLPGISGEKGIPIWCYYVNRGQCVVSFGVDNKDHSIMEFYPAHQAYQNVKTTGFRTFVKKDGKVTEFGCGNFPESEEQGKDLVKQVIMRGHSWLPLGEFAIGTNTTAYAMAQKYQIGSKLPILIAEKTGPHFAVGDTCYSHEEDMVTYNPDGKQIVARENDFSKLRSEDMSKAYFNCHTDITIPYDELDKITVIRKDGTTEDIISDGRFVLAGIEELNKPLDR